MPPLSFADKLIYWFLFIILSAATVALPVLIFDLRDKIAYSDPYVVAAIGDDLAVLRIILPGITVFLIWFIPVAQCYQDRKPIFGLRNFKYGPPAWPKEYPLLMKNKPFVWESQVSKQRRKRIATIVLALLLVSLLQFPLSLCGRDCLRQDGSIVRYNLFNSETHNYPSGQIKEVRLETYWRSRKGKRLKFYGSWRVRMVLVTDSG